MANPAQMMLPEYDQETASTRVFFERLPDDKLDWKPHEKSMSLGQLANHIAEIPGWLTQALNTDSLDLAPPGGEPWKPAAHASTDEIIDFFDGLVAEARQALESSKPESWGDEWSLLQGGNVLLAMPRGAVVRGMVMNHLVHHRGQLSVYLRMLDIPVPQAYGPTADES